MDRSTRALLLHAEVHGDHWPNGRGIFCSLTFLSFIIVFFCFEFSNECRQWIARRATPFARDHSVAGEESGMGWIRNQIKITVHPSSLLVDRTNLNATYCMRIHSYENIFESLVGHVLQAWIPARERGPNFEILNTFSIPLTILKKYYFFLRSLKLFKYSEKKNWVTVFFNSL